MRGTPTSQRAGALVQQILLHRDKLATPLGLPTRMALSQGVAANVGYAVMTTRVDGGTTRMVVGNGMVTMLRQKTFGVMRHDEPMVLNQVRCFTITKPWPSLMVMSQRMAFEFGMLATSTYSI